MFHIDVTSQIRCDLTCLVTYAQCKVLHILVFHVVELGVSPRRLVNQSEDTNFVVASRLNDISQEANVSTKLRGWRRGIFLRFWINVLCQNWKIMLIYDISTRTRMPVCIRPVRYNIARERITLYMSALKNFDVFSYHTNKTQKYIHRVLPYIVIVPMFFGLLGNALRR